MRLVPVGVQAKRWRKQQAVAAAAAWYVMRQSAEAEAEAEAEEAEVEAGEDEAMVQQHAELLVLLVAAGVLDDERPPRMPLLRMMPPVDDDIPNDFMNHNFRFTYTELQHVAEAIRWPWEGYVRGPDRCRLPGKEALCMLLYVLATPKCVVDCSYMWGLSQQTCSRWLIWLAHELSQRLLPFCRFRWAYLKPRLGLYAAAIRRRTDGLLGGTVGFIDGHNPPIARPSRPEMDREFYSGQRKQHCVSVQGVCFPDGLVFVSDPISGRKNDLNLYDESGIDAELQQHLLYDVEVHGPVRGGVQLLPGQTHFNLFGDPIYQARLQPWLWAQWRPFRNVPLLPHQRHFNGWTRAARSDIEHAFAHVGNLFHGHRHKAWARTLSSGRFLQTYALTFALMNVRTMLRCGNHISIDNNMEPPTIAEYLA